MARPKPDKHALLAFLAAHVLEHGLNTASLRPMAAAADTSDRMLIYHFGSKDGLIGELLQHLAADMARGLDQALPPVRVASEAELITQIMQLMRSPPFRPYVRLWLDIVATAAQGGTAHLKAANGIIDTYLDWIALRHPQGHDGAAITLTLVEGMLIMDAVGQTDVADQARALLAKR